MANEFTIIPAIDLKGGRCVRLRQGRADDSTIYADDPVEIAMRWVGQGAAYLHIVDLDGAFEGRPVHRNIITRIAATVPVPIEVGGGLRTDEDIKALIDCGVDRAIIGTRALSDPDALRELTRRFGVHLAVGIDARDGWVQVKGWVETTGLQAAELARRADAAGVRTLIYTDTARDGMMEGTNAQAVDEICGTVSCNVIASGGVSSAADVSSLRALSRANLSGVIVGKALYEENVTLADLHCAAQTEVP